MDILIVPVLAILLPLILVPTILVMKHRQQRRKWDHLERLKAMETRLPIPLRQALTGAGGVTAIGAGVPSISVLGALMTTLLWEPAAIGDAVAVPAIAWSCALFISAMAMGTSLKLTSMHRQAAQEAAEMTTAMSNGKAVYDPDAFDVVSSRG
jgi:hypothetical protein